MLALIFAGADLFQHFAITGDLEALGFDREAEVLCNFALDFRQFVAFEFDDFFAVATNDMIVVWMLGVVRIVVFVILSEIHLPDQAALG